MRMELVQCVCVCDKLQMDRNIFGGTNFLLNEIYSNGFKWFYMEEIDRSIGVVFNSIPFKVYTDQLNFRDSTQFSFGDYKVVTKSMF